MTRDELIQAVPIRESQGHPYVRIDDVPAPWREQFAAAMEGSAFIAIKGETCMTPFAHDWEAWVHDQWHGRPGPTGLDADSRFVSGQSGAVNRGPRSPWKTRYFVDTEFTDFKDSQLISIAVVGEDGREFYGECSDFERKLCSDFVRGIVLPQLGQLPSRSMPFAALRGELQAWLLAVPLKPKPVLCYDSNCDYELVTHLLGGPLPRGWKHENVFLKIDAELWAEYIAVHGGEHHALYDARANAYAFR